jgi:DNA-binding CsgD family transcriptional regulator
MYFVHKEPDISDYEKAILRLLSQGRTEKEIAEKMKEFPSPVVSLYAMDLHSKANC